MCKNLIHISRSDALTSIKVLPLGWRVERRRSGEHQKARPDPKAQPEIAKSQRFMNKPPLGDIFRPEVFGDRRKRDRRIVEAVLEHGYTQREVADHLRIHFTSVSRILRAKEKMLTK